MTRSESKPEPTAPRLGLVDRAALTATFFALGITLQVLLIDRGTPAWTAFTASAVILSATSQFAYLSVREAGGSDGAAIVAGAIVATRFGILAMSLAPRLPAGGARRAAAAVTVLDPNVAVAVQQRSPVAVEHEFWRTTAALLIGWFGGIAVGTFLGNVLGDIDRFGLDAVFPAALLAIIANLLRSREGRSAAAAGGVVCVVLLPVAPAGVPIIMSAAGAVAAVWLGRRTEQA